MDFLDSNPRVRTHTKQKLGGVLVPENGTSHPDGRIRLLSFVFISLSSDPYFFLFKGGRVRRPLNWGGGENPPSAVKTAYVYFLLFLFLYLLYVVGLYGMNNLWKVLITFCVLAVFVFVFAFVLAYFISGSSIPVFGGGKIAVIPVHGVILSAGCGDNVFTQDSCVSSGGLSRRLREADADSSVDAIILDIYSGGGQVVASREIMREVRKTKKPVVAWIGEVGASGAYYIASAADSIVADDNSLTGSIGVVMTIPHYYGLMEKVGVNVTVVKTGDSKDIGSPYRPMTEEENMMFLNMTETVYGSFPSWFPLP